MSSISVNRATGASVAISDRPSAMSLAEQSSPSGRPLRIGLIAPPWAQVPPVGYGGTEAVIDQLARGLDKAGTEVVLFTVGDSTCPVPRGSTLVHAEGMRIGSCVPELRHALAAYDFMAQAEVDVIHDHTIAGPVMAGSARFSDIPVVTTNHGPFNDELNDLYRRICDAVSVIAISEDQASRAEGVRIAEVIHHGIDPSAFPVGRGDGGYLLFLGRMAIEKGAHRAIRVAQATGKKLIIAAKMREESETRYFRKMIEPHLTDRIVYVGEVAGKVKSDLLAGAEALINPIRWPEPFGLVMIEAMAHGTPVISFRSGAAPEIITHEIDGFLGDHTDDLIAAVKGIHQIDRRRPRATVMARFSTDRMTANHLAFYRTLVNEPALGVLESDAVTPIQPVVARRSGSKVLTSLPPLVSNQ